MRLAIGVVRKSVVVLALAAATAGVCALPAQAAGGSTDLFGSVRNDPNEASNDYPRLEDDCRRLDGIRWERLMNTPDGGFQAALRCFF